MMSVVIAFVRPSKLVFLFVLALNFSLIGRCVAQPLSQTTYQSVYKKVDNFLGPMRGDYILPGALVSDQVGEAMGGPDTTLNAGLGRTLITGFRPHSGEERAAVLLDDHNNVLAIGLINAHCQIATCQNTHTLTIFAPVASLDYSLLKPFVDWTEALRPDYAAISRVTGQPFPARQVEFEFRSTK